MWLLHDCWQIRWITNNNDVRPLHKDTLDRAAEAGADRPVTGTQVARLATRHVSGLERRTTRSPKVRDNGYPGIVAFSR